GSVEQNVAGILRALCEHGNRDILDDRIEELAGPEQVLFDLIVRLGARVSHPLAIAVACLVGRADEFAQLGEIDLSSRFGGTAELLGEQAMHAQATAPGRVQAS